MPNPKRKHSHARSATRRTHWKLIAPTLVPHPGHRTNPKCPELLPPHTACPACGIYNGRVYSVKEIRHTGRTTQKAEPESE